MNEGLQSEVNSTIKHKLHGSYTYDEIDIYSLRVRCESRSLPDKIKMIPIVALYYTGWNKRSTGRVYNSLSGNTFLIGCRSGNVIHFDTRAKKCAKCARTKRLVTNTSPHRFTINHERSGRSMEAKLTLDLTKELFAKKGAVWLKQVVSDDDPTIRALLQHTSNHSKGILPSHILQPLFLADPPHRIKLMSKSFLKWLPKQKIQQSSK